ncbi:hypothetical protein LshimejAT787_0410410 [Lyophyllum shimeji]|uniref:Uncharacterized protein n=1 Tax=Lyophyllum shimeji TaxID=47721 RepID=A0A9P3UNL4_LYOSH|nr:hypothetical protein LshimejAT787_0410410 [Lyophyllum shimeji]
MISKRMPVTIGGDPLSATPGASSTTDSNEREDIIPAVIPWTPFSLHLLTHDTAEAHKDLIDDLADLRNGTTVVERFDGTWDRFTPDIAKAHKRSRGARGRAAWPPVYSRPPTFKFDPFADDDADAPSSPQSFCDSSASLQLYGHATADVHATALVSAVFRGPTRPRPRAFVFDPFGDNDNDNSAPGSPPEYYSCSSSSASTSLLLSTPQDTYTKVTFSSWGADSTASHTPDSFYAPADDSPVKCTVSATGKIWAPVPRVPMGPALAAFEVHAFAAMLPDGLAGSVSTGFEGKGRGKERMRMRENAREEEGSGGRGVFRVFREEEEVAPEGNGNAALYDLAATGAVSMDRGRRGVSGVFREPEESDIAAGARAPVPVACEVNDNDNAVLYETAPVPHGQTSSSADMDTDMVTAMKDLLRMQPGEAKDEMARRAFGSGVHAPNAPRMSTVPLPCATPRVFGMSEEEVYEALVPVPPRPRPAADLGSLQLELLRVLRYGC